MRVNFFILQFIDHGWRGRWWCGNPVADHRTIQRDAGVARDVSLCLIVFALYMPAKMFNYVNVVGVLRSGGDTTICLFLDCTGVWLIGVPLAFLGGLYFKFPIYTVYALVISEEIYKFVLGYIRYRQKKWLRNSGRGDCPDTLPRRKNRA